MSSPAASWERVASPRPLRGRRKGTQRASPFGAAHRRSLAHPVWRRNGRLPRQGQPVPRLAGQAARGSPPQLTVADLRGDLEGQLAADAMLRNERESDGPTLTAIKKRLTEIEDLLEVT